ncbi:hypothetical protein [Chryseobacterium angstadtii]|uniref:hypothetical protein n=1 Tax=Chryseobacterium angstadtii TaxID=558151 RepID=UPI000A9DAA7F|nr:hypothetical protein [Chryseobacterium angstadtii]
MKKKYQYAVFPALLIICLFSFIYLPRQVRQATGISILSLAKMTLMMVTAVI